MRLKLNSLGLFSFPAVMVTCWKPWTLSGSSWLIISSSSSGHSRGDTGGSLPMIWVIMRLCSSADASGNNAFTRQVALSILTRLPLWPVPFSGNATPLLWIILSSWGTLSLHPRLMAAQTRSRGGFLASISIEQEACLDPGGNAHGGKTRVGTCSQPQSSAMLTLKQNFATVWSLLTTTDSLDNTR